jgi:hypothetical protein
VVNRHPQLACLSAQRCPSSVNRDHVGTGWDRSELGRTSLGDASFASASIGHVSLAPSGEIGRTAASLCLPLTPIGIGSPSFAPLGSVQLGIGEPAALLPCAHSLTMFVRVVALPTQLGVYDARNACAVR